MKRRRLIALISLCTLATFGVLAMVAGVVVMRTDMATNFVRSRIAAAVNGSVYLGRISGNPFSGITIDSLMIRDRAGEIVVSTGRVTTSYDIRDLIDTRIHLRHVVAEHPYLHLRRHASGKWNYQELLGSGTKGPRRDAPGRSWGDFVVLDSVRAVDATFMLSLDWSPDDTLSAAARDSVIRRELARTDRLIRKTPDGYARTYMWTKASGEISHARLVDPDSNQFGQEIHIASLDANEFDPPLRIRNLRGVVRRHSDSAWINFPHWDLPGSTGSATGKLVWGSDLPIRYDFVLQGDSVSLADLNWVYPTLPKTGGGRMKLTISNKRNLRVMDYRIYAMDVRTTGSHLTGEMTFGVGGPVLQLRNVNLKADPVDFDFIKTLNGKPFPIDWRGQIFADIRASGGPLTDFEVDAASGMWRDTHVPGAVSRLSGSGGLNILVPALTKFQDFDVDVGTLDMRSIQYLFPAFPKLAGTISGQATLDSIWTDVRFRSANITHRDGPGPPSRFTGSGRITDGRPFITYNLDLVADPLSFDMLARSFPAIKLRGLARGPISIRGQSPDLQIVASLASAGGTVRFAGNIDIDSLGGYGARGRGEVAGLNLAQLLTRPTAPLTSLNAQYTLGVRGSSLATLTGLAEVRLDSSRIDSLRLSMPTLATVRFENGRAILGDTVYVKSPMGELRAIGAIGSPGDSINVTLTVDSVGGLRPYFSSAKAGAAPDSLAGRVVLNGIASGRLDSLAIHGIISGTDLFIRGFDARRLDGTFSIFDALRAPRGDVAAQFQDVAVGGLLFDSLATTLDIADTAHAAFRVRGVGPLGENLGLSANGAWTSLGGTTAVRLDAFEMALAETRWTLERPATLVVDSGMFRIDSVGLRDARGGSIGIAGLVPKVGPVDLRLSAARVPLADLDRVIGQVGAPLSGFADLAARVTGTRDHPIIDARTALDSIAISDVRIGRLLSTARYADNVASVNAEIFQGDRRVLRATADSLPLSVRFFGYDTLPGRVRLTATADSADFTLIQTMVKDVSAVKGKVFGDLMLDGTWSAPRLTANARLVDGEMRIDTLGIALANMGGQVAFRNDTLLIAGLRAQSGGERNTASLLGAVVFQKWTPAWFNVEMRMNDFQAYNRSELATIYARTDSGPVILRGSFAADTLIGVINVDRGAIYLPDPKLVGKRFSQVMIEADSIGRGRAARDTTKALYDRVTQNLFTDLRVHLGGEFRLSATYADIPLSGDLNIVLATRTDAARNSSEFINRLAPVGVINADRGTYTLELFPFSKRFDVQRGGTITFDRDVEWNGLLNVSARYVVRKFGRPEVPIIVDVTDRLLTPKVKPRSEASYYISDSDLISYILIDEPGFDILGQAQGLGLVSLFTPLATSFATEQLKKTLLGRWVDQIRVETASLDQTNGASNSSALSLVYGTRFAGEKQLLRDKVFVSISAGLCGLDANYRNSLDQSLSKSLSEQVGVNLDYRLRSTMSTGATWQLATEPSTVALLCSPGYAGTQGTAPTPRQFSLSFLKFWRW